jgi:type VI secretion system protein ImpL
VPTLLFRLPNYSKVTPSLSAKPEEVDRQPEVRETEGALSTSPDATTPPSVSPASAGDRQRDAKELLSLIERTSASTTLRDTDLIDVAAKCTSMITGRYPFVPNGPGVRDVRLLDFGDLFGYGGTFHQFFTTHLEKFVDTTRHPWTWKPGAPSGVPLSVFQQAQRIREMFFEQGSRVPRLEFTVRFSQLDGAERVLLEVEGNTVPLYRQDGDRRWTMTWPGPKPGRAVVTFGDHDKMAKVSAEGDWAWFKVMDQGSITKIDPEHFRLAIGKDKYRVVITIDALRGNNVFGGLDALHSFRCGG